MSSIKKKNLGFLHITSPITGMCSNIIRSQLCLNHADIEVPVEDVIKIGAVFIKTKTDVKIRRMFTDTLLSEGDLIRYPPVPKRFMDVYNVNWKKTIVNETKDYFIVNKPSRIPSHATVDNYPENLLHSIRLEMKHETDLNLPHRLDSDTSGLIVVSKNKDFNIKFCNILKARKNIKKKYRAIIASPSREAVLNVIRQFNSNDGDNNIYSNDFKNKTDDNSYSNNDCNQNSSVSNSTDTSNSSSNNDNDDNTKTKQELKNAVNNILLRNYIIKTKKSPKIFENISSDNNALCELMLSSNTDPMTKSVSEWMKWVDNLDNKKNGSRSKDRNCKEDCTEGSGKDNDKYSDKYDENEISNFKYGIYDWINNCNASHDNSNNNNDKNSNSDDFSNINQADCENNNIRSTNNYISKDIKHVINNDCSHSINIQDDDDSKCVTFWEVEINLLTGKKNILALI